MLTALAQNWWALVVRGILAFTLGVFAWIRPDLFWASLLLLFGVYAAVDGLFALYAAISGERGKRWTHLVEGVIGLSVGALAIIFPNQAGAVIVLVIGAWAIGTGALELLSAIRLRQEIEGEWLLAVGGVLSIVLGLFLVLRPQFGAVVTTYVLGTYGIIFGVVLVLLGFRLRGLKPTATAGG